jgi:formyltetrahydrofolate deformylase
MTAHIVLIECADRPGLVHAVTGVLLAHGLNITSNSEFVDREGGRFFMRTEAEGAADPAALEAALRAALPAEAVVRLPGGGRRRIVVLATREYHCLGDLLVRHAFGDLNAEIAAVISNHADLEPFVRRFDVPFHAIPHEGKSREAHEEELLAAIAPYAPEYLVLAKYMRILSGAFVAHYPNRILNIHHSFLPAFAGAAPYQQAYERGVKIIGATAHYVTENLDEGPIIAQGVVPVDHTYGAAEMARAGREVEKAVLARAVKLVCDERVFLFKGRTILFE